MEPLNSFKLNDEPINFTLNAEAEEEESIRLLEDEDFRLLEDGSFRILE